jgi:hypothetical protein
MFSKKTAGGIPDYDFYSIYARVLISSWEELTAIIQKYALIQFQSASKDKANPTEPPPKIPSNEQIQEAMYNAAALLKKFFQAIAAFHKSMRTIHAKYDQINQQSNLITKALEKILTSPDKDQKITIMDIEEKHETLGNEEKETKNLLEKLKTCDDNLNDLINKFQKDWEENYQAFATKAMERLESVLNIKFSNLEKKELQNPAYNRSELLAAIKQFNLSDMIKEYLKKGDLGDILELRLFWLLGAARGRTLTEIDMKQARNVIKYIKREKSIADSKLLTDWQQEQSKLDGELKKIEKQAENLLGLSVEEEKQLTAILPLAVRAELLPKAIAAGPSPEAAL